MAPTVEATVEVAAEVTADGRCPSVAIWCGVGVTRPVEGWPAGEGGPLLSLSLLPPWGASAYCSV